MWASCSAPAAAGLTNILLDALFVAGFRWGLVGAAAATALSQCVGGVLPLVYFSRPNSSLLRLTRTEFDGKALARTCASGSSELMSNISMSVVSMLYNFQLLRYAGEDGVAAYGVLMYVSMIFQAVFIGYSVGAAISFLRTLVFQVIAVLLFSLVWKLDGIWLSIVGAEVMAITVTMLFLAVKRNRYHY